MIRSAETKGSPTGTPEADELLRKDANALIIGIMLDQQTRAEMAFTGPYRLKERLGHLDMARIADMDEEELASVFQEKPAVHRFYNMMAGRVQELARYLQEHYDGRAEGLWKDTASIDDVKKRARKIPGFGTSKVNALEDALKLFGHRD